MKTEFSPTLSRRLPRLLRIPAVLCLIALSIAGVVNPASAHPASRPTADQCGNNQYYREYFDNRDLQGGANNGSCVNGPEIDEHWDPWSANQGTWRFNFSVRWTGWFHFDEGYYNFKVDADDGVRIKVDGYTVVEAWRDQSVNNIQGGTHVYAGQHQVVVEYYQHEGGARLHLHPWTNQWLFPPSMTSCENVQIPIESWCAEYFNSSTPSYTPVVARFEDKASGGLWMLDKDFDAPGVRPGGVQSQNFSVIWRGRFYFDRGHSYRFSAIADDGFKVNWMDRQLTLLEDWISPHPSNMQETTRRFDDLSNDDINPHEIEVVWKQYGGAAFVHVGWQDLGTSPGGGGGGTEAGSACDGGEGVYLYEHTWYQGRCTKFTANAPDARLWSIGNDSASSLRFVGNWDAFLYADTNYQGHSYGYQQDMPDFNNMNGLNDRISSIKIRRR